MVLEIKNVELQNKKESNDEFLNYVTKDKKQEQYKLNSVQKSFEQILKVTKELGKKSKKIDETLCLYPKNLGISKFFAEYSNYLFAKNKKMSEEKAIDVLNDAYLRSVYAELIPVFREYYGVRFGVKKEGSEELEKTQSELLIEEYKKQKAQKQNMAMDIHPIDFSKDVFADVCAFVETSLMKKYAVQKFEELEKNELAKIELGEYRNWRENAEREKLSHIRQNFHNAQIQNPEDFINQSIVTTLCGVAVGGLVTGLGFTLLYGDIDDPDYFSLLAKMLAVGAVVGGVIGGCIEFWYKFSDENSSSQAECSTPDDYFNDFLNYLSIDKQTFVSTIENYVQNMTQSEKDALVNCLKANTELQIALDNNFTSSAEMYNYLDTHQVTQKCSRDSALTELGIVRDREHELYAKQNGFSSYEELINYIEQHTIIEGDYTYSRESKHSWGAGWSVSSYDTPEALSYAKQLNYIDSTYNEKKNQIDLQSWPQDIVTYDEIGQKVVQNLKASEMFYNEIYGKLVNTPNAGLSYDATSQYFYTEYINKFGVEDANNRFNIKPREGSSLVSNGLETKANLSDVNSSEVLDGIADTISLSSVPIMGTGIGAVVGCSVVSTIVRYRNVFTEKFSKNKAEKVSNKLEAINQMREEREL